MTRLRIFCTPFFTNINIKVVIQMHAFLFDPITPVLRKCRFNLIIGMLYFGYNHFRLIDHNFGPRIYIRHILHGGARSFRYGSNRKNNCDMNVLLH